MSIAKRMWKYSIICVKSLFGWRLMNLSQNPSLYSQNGGSIFRALSMNVILSNANSRGARAKTFQFENTSQKKASKRKMKQAKLNPKKMKSKSTSYQNS